MKNSVLKFAAFIFLCICFLDLKCKKNIYMDTLPPITSEGKNTFGCYVNGQLFCAKGAFNIASLSGGYIKRNFWIKSNYVVMNPNHNGFKYKQKIAFGFLNKYPLSNFQIVLNSKDIGLFSDLNTNSKDYITDSLNNGIVSFSRFDTINRVISGTFYFTAKSSDSSIIRVTDGRFDLQY